MTKATRIANKLVRNLRRDTKRLIQAVRELKYFGEGEG